MQGLFSPRQLGRLTADLASLFRSAIEKAGLRFEVEWDSDETRPVYVDSDLWEKICFNVRSLPPSLESLQPSLTLCPLTGGNPTAYRQRLQVHPCGPDQSFYSLWRARC